MLEIEDYRYLYTKGNILIIINKNMHKIDNYKHKISMTVRFSDLDAMGHVNNAAYLSYLEEARIGYFNDILNYSKNNLAFGAVIARIEIDYISQIKLGDEVEVYTRCLKIGNKSSDLDNLIVIKKDRQNIIASHSITKLVAFDYSLGTSVVIPNEIKEIIREYEK